MGTMRNGAPDAEGSRARAWARDTKAACRDMWLCLEAVPYKDDPMTPADWDKLASWQRHFAEPASLMRLLRAMSVLQAWVMLVTALLVLYTIYLMPYGWPHISSDKFITVFQVASFAVALLITFRTTTAYDRWWEARTDIGKWLACKRNMQRLLMAWAPPGDAPLVAEFTRWNASAVAAGCVYLTGDQSHWAAVDDLLRPDELQWLGSEPNPAVVVTSILSQLLARVDMNPMHRSTIETEVNHFIECLGSLERIAFTSIPKAYTRHTSRCLVAFVTFLPCALAAPLRWWALPTMFFLTFLLFGIENIGAQIENPIRVLPMHAYATGFKAAILALAAANKRTEAVAEGLTSPCGPQRATRSCLSARLGGGDGQALSFSGGAELLSSFPAHDGGGGGGREWRPAYAGGAPSGVSFVSAAPSTCPSSVAVREGQAMAGCGGAAAAQHPVAALLAGAAAGVGACPATACSNADGGALSQPPCVSDGPSCAAGGCSRSCGRVAAGGGGGCCDEWQQAGAPGATYAAGAPGAAYAAPPAAGRSWGSHLRG